MHKKNRKVDLFQCKIKFYFTHEHQNLYFHLFHENTAFELTFEIKYPLYNFLGLA